MKKKFCPCGKELKKPFQKYCDWTCLNTYAEHKTKPKCKGIKRKRSRTVEREEIEKLRSRADVLFQIRGKELYPVSIINGDPTEVIHHFIYKSQSKTLRYDFNNAIPLTNSQHCRHHQSGDPTIVAEIIRKKGLKWEEGLQQQRRIITKHNKEYLEGIIESLSTPTPF